jgi:hypothetical protein
MKTLTDLKFTVSDEQIIEPRGIISAVHEEPARGFHRVIQLGSAGLFIRHGDAVVCIPRAALLQAAEQAEPALVPPPPGSAGVSPAAALAKKIAGGKGQKMEDGRSKIEGQNIEDGRSKIEAGSALPISHLPSSALALLLLLSAFCFPNFCFSQLVFPKVTALTGYTNLLAGTNYAPNSEVLFYRDRGFALIATAVATNTGEVGPLRLSFQLSADRTNYTTTTPLTWTFAITGTNYVRAYTNFPAAVVDNIRSGILIGVTNLAGPSATCVQVTNITAYIVP